MKRKIKIAKIRTKCVAVNGPHWDFYYLDCKQNPCNIACAIGFTHAQAKVVARALSEETK